MSRVLLPNDFLTYFPYKEPANYAALAKASGVRKENGGFAGIG